MWQFWYEIRRRQGRDGPLLLLLRQVDLLDEAVAELAQVLVQVHVVVVVLVHDPAIDREARGSKGGGQGREPLNARREGAREYRGGSH